MEVYIGGSNMKNYWLDKDKKMSIDTCRQVAARIWCDKEFGIIMDCKAAEEIAKILLRVAEKQNK